MTMRSMVLLILFAVVTATPVQFAEEWNAWKSLHGRSYSSEEEELQRHTAWVANRQYIEDHNTFSAEKTGFTLAMNQFGDLTSSEFLKLYTHHKSNYTQGHTVTVKTYNPPEGVSLPDAMDWRTKGAVTPIKNQGHCGASYVFSAVGALEGAHALAFDKLVSLSEQNAVDCSVPYGNDGCNGGTIKDVFQYVIDNQGIDTEDSYPFTGKQGPCHFNKNTIGAVQTGIVKIPSGSEASLLAAVATAGPVSISVDGSSNAFRFYAGGVFDEPNCSSTKQTHSMLVIGYGMYKGKQFWLVKNSWGTQWGKEGYIMMTRNQSNQCGIATDATFPTL